MHGLSLGTTDVEFLLTNMSNNLLVVDRICVEIMHWEQYDGPLTTGARIIDYKYKVNIKPNFIGEIPVPNSKFKYPKGDVDSFSFSFFSPPGNKYITRINFYCSDLETDKKFAVSTEKFEIRFHKQRTVTGGGASSDAIATAQKLIIEETKRKEINFYCSDPETGKKFGASADKSSIHDDALAQARKIVDDAKRGK